ncbi:hypothetical protein BFW01_g7866 [Lasiodiplodia theobromae]|uniref:uncharacterized protein n=1 Tax=Lasiodiplodia theobromae TaxID=45133 RepID=UPI0015C34F69|nr:uncharacterized protein LTHEOB_3334 [Lasiodiplodia theobromae]KAF4534526.1 hypothetical protein LTHEOB_3334 [Lasiodiplodia theobromae]KAF9636970.1 hypothetical protein BFW01_g7866 [Lasiodiplodia theobromae]
MDTNNTATQDHNELFTANSERVTSLCDKYDEQLKIYEGMIRDKDGQVKALRAIQAANDKKIADLEKQLKEMMGELHDMNDLVPE